MCSSAAPSTSSRSSCPVCWCSCCCATVYSTCSSTTGWVLYCGPIPSGVLSSNWPCRATSSTSRSWGSEHWAFPSPSTSIPSACWSSPSWSSSAPSSLPSAVTSCTIAVMGSWPGTSSSTCTGFPAPMPSWCFYMDSDPSWREWPMPSSITTLWFSSRCSQSSKWAWFSSPWASSISWTAISPRQYWYWRWCTWDAWWWWMSCFYSSIITWLRGLQVWRPICSSWFTWW